MVAQNTSPYLPAPDYLPRSGRSPSRVATMPKKLAATVAGLEAPHARHGKHRVHHAAAELSHAVGSAIRLTTVRKS